MVTITPTNSKIIDMEIQTLPGEEDIEAANTFKSAKHMVATARSAFISGKTKSIEFRRDQLKQLLLLFEENTEVLANALLLDLNKHPIESMMFETEYVKSVIIKTLMNMNDWVKPEKPTKPLLYSLEKIKICNDSLGVVLIIGAWNFPIQIVFAPLIGAIAAGNCAIIKPSEVARACESVVAKLVPKYLDKECYQVFVGGVEEMDELLAERFDHIFFTGSTFVGRIIHRAANKYLTPVTLELGGKSPTYIDESANLNLAMQKIMWAKFANAGQICLAPDYILCTKEMQDKIIPMAKDIIREFYGDDIQSSEYYGRIINNNHFQRLTKFLNREENIAMGGKFDERRRFIEPTILVNVSSNDPIMQEEIFGPILPIITVNSPKEAIHFINTGEKPLIIHIFTVNKEVKDLFINNTSSGTITINDPYASFIIDTLPFGGVGFSGMGRYHGKFSYDTFVHKKSVYESSVSYFTVNKILSMRYPPYSKIKEQVIRMVLKARNEKFVEYLNSILIFISGALFVIIITTIFNAIKN